MAAFVLKAGHHYHAMPPLSTLPWVGSQRMVRYVTFDASCKYYAAPYNSQDVNKLFGLDFGFGGVHHNSARFGWRWSDADQCIELLAYVYKEGVRNQDEQLRFPVVAQVKPGQRVYCMIQYTGTSFYFRVVNEELNIYGEVMVPTATTLPKYGLTHGLYFGGELTAPHEMSVRIDR